MRAVLMGLILVATGWLFDVATANADVGPKPSVDIVVRWSDGTPPADAVIYAQMLTCYAPDITPSQRCGFADAMCNKFIPLAIAEPSEGCTWRIQGPPMVWGGECRGGSCNFTYFLPTRFRLAAYLPSADQMFVSNPVTRAGLSSAYRLNVTRDGAAQLVETTPPLRRWHLSGALVALLLSLTCELALGYLFIRLTHSPRRALLGVLIGNLLTVPALWLVLAALPGSVFLLTLVLAEVAAVIIEGGLIAGLTRRRMRPQLAFAMSLALNCASFVLGVPALAILTLFGVVT